MNKNEYLAALKVALKDTDENIMDEIISDYEEHFQVGMQKGKSEEEICEDLGSIDDLVEEIKEVYQGDTKSKDDEKAGKEEKETDKDTSKNKKFIHIDIDGKKIGDAINDALDSAGEAISNIDVLEISNSIKNTLGQAATSLNNFADSCFKNFDFDNRKGEGYTENVSKSYDDTDEAKEETTADSTDTKVNDSEENDTEEQKDEESKQPKGLNLFVDGFCADIHVVKSENGKVNINYVNNGNERQKQMYEFYSYKDGNTIYAGVRRVGRSVFLFNLKATAMMINVELPENMSHVTVKTISGDIKIAGVKADQLSAEAANGEVKTSDVEAKNLSIKSFSGDIRAKNVTADIIYHSSLSGDLDMDNIKTGECKIRSTSGDITINEFTMNNADVSSVSGDLKISDIVGDGLRACSTSGDLNLEVNVKMCHASSKSGDVSVKCNGDVALESSSISGDINVDLKNFGNGYSIKSRTTTGELYINYNDIHQRNLKTGSYSYGNQGSELILGTVSGDIHVND